MVVVILISSLIASPAFCQDTEDSQLFIAGFNAYQQKDYASSIEKMNEVLQKHPDTPLRDMALFWLSRSYFKVGNQQEAARYLSQFSKEYPDNPLKSTVEDELLALTARFEKGEKLVGGPPPVRPPDLLAAQKIKAQKELAAAVEAEEAKRAAAAAESVRVTAATAEQDRIALEAASREKAEQQKVAALKAEESLKITQQIRMAVLASEQEMLAAAKAEESKLAAAVAAEEKKEQERLAVYRAEQNQLAVLKNKDSQRAPVQFTEVTADASKRAYREKAISEYKSIIDKYPASAAAVTAAAKLRELGIVTALPPAFGEASPLENTQVLRFEVVQFAAFEFNLLARPETFTAGRQFEVPFEVINRGNGVDSFYLDSAFPAEFGARFASTAFPGGAINQTPELGPGETFKGSLSFVIPPASIDGLRITYPVKVASRLAAEASQSREVKVITSAPLLRAILRTEKTRPLPGDKVLYRIAILNAGSDAAQDVTFRVNFPPQFEPVDYVAAGFRQEMKSALVVDGMQVKSGESREFSVAFQLKDDSLAGQELLARVELINTIQKTAAAFVSNTAYVEPQRSILVRTGSERLVAFPGQTIAVPFVVTNKSNIREKYKIVSVVSGLQEAVIFHDINRDGIRQAGEPVITEIGPLAPHEEASVVVEIKTAKRAIDGSQDSVKVSFVSEGDPASAASGATQLTYSRPVLNMAMSGRDGRLKPGDVTSFDLVIANQGSNIARIVELQSVWPEQLELMAADPATSVVSNGAIVWRFKELGAGEKRSIRVSFRVKPGIGVGTAIQVKNILTYEDRLGNRY
ncbi:MAG TPA: tetratricopeptide repeat protein [Desulfuromonadales bacterium]|nr:tetratricopeptide repeat protein [Desulfuromonadales bacterium]